MTINKKVERREKTREVSAVSRDAGLSDFAQLVLIAVSFLLRKCHWNYHLEVLLAIIAQQSL